jgi:surface antigen
MTLAKTPTRTLCLTLAVALPAGALIGCANTQTREKGAGIGALTGAVVGGAIGYAIDDSAEGVIIGALAGAAIGGVTGYVIGKQLEDRDETAHEYQRELAAPGVDEVLDIKRVTLDPDFVEPGGLLDVNLVHAYVGPVDQEQDFEVELMLVDEGGAILLSQAQTQVYENGTYASTITFEVPAELEPGRYGIDVSMHTGGVTDNASAVFNVL